MIRSRYRSADREDGNRSGLIVDAVQDSVGTPSGAVPVREGWAELLADAVNIVRPAAEAKQIRLRKIVDPHAGPISGDPTRLQQIIWNLLSNALKFTPKDGNIEVLLQRVNSHVELTISDSGIGIKPDFIDRIFERFRQADASTTRSHGGLGLGL